MWWWNNLTISNERNLESDKNFVLWEPQYLAIANPQDALN